jgi:signal transduction histidine kinase
MVNQAQEGTSLILYGGMLGMFFLAFAIVGFVIIYKRRLMKQYMKLQEQKILHQQQLLNTSVEIQDEERKRFAADLHDEIGGGISTVLLSVSKLKKEAIESTNTVAQSEKIHHQLNDLLKKTREISYNIMPPTLEDFGLNEALSDVCFTISEAKVISVDYQWNGDETRLNFSQELTLYRIIKEILVNVVKHANATKVAIIIDNTSKHFKFLIEDNGKGFDTKTVKKGAGLRNIKDRALIVGAELIISSKINSGTTAHLHLNK